MNNLEIYNRVRAVPDDAKKPITAGRLKGKTDINPMWRIKALTEAFGPAGFGWYTTIISQDVQQGHGDERIAIVRIHLFVKMGEEWSKPIEGIGGSAFTTKESNGVHTSDECFKMAYTDAISVACKALGVGADVYWQADRTKYDQQQKQQQAKQEQTPKNKAKLTAIILANEAKAKQLYDFIKQSEAKAEQMLDPVNLLRQYYDFGDDLKESIYKLYNNEKQ
jgi:hypothetical protein